MDDLSEAWEADQLSWGQQKEQLEREQLEALQGLQRKQALLEASAVQSRGLAAVSHPAPLARGASVVDMPDTSLAAEGISGEEGGREHAAGCELTKELIRALDRWQAQRHAAEQVSPGVSLCVAVLEIGWVRSGGCREWGVCLDKSRRCVGWHVASSRLA